MKFDKEYPATHSMSTAWYVADEEGNVAIIDYNDNGPVPWQTEQTCIEELVFGHKENFKTKEFIPINLTDEQIYDLLNDYEEPNDDYDFWLYDTIAQIDKTQENEFMGILNNQDDIKWQCISKQIGLYKMDCYSCFIDKRQATHKHPLKSSSLYKILKSKMILRLYHQKDFYVNDEWKDEKLVFECDFSSAPYFIFKQPYWNELLVERLIIPEHPVKLSQFPEPLRKRVHRVPIIFSECKQFQIAEWHPCEFTSVEEKYVNGCRYGLLTLTDGKEAYVMADMDEVDFYPYCSEKDKYHCIKCTCNCASCSAHFFTNKPTVMSIVSPFSEYDYNNTITSDIIVKSSVIMPFLPRIPKQIDQLVFLDNVKKIVTPQMLESFYLKNFQYLEDMVMRYNPRVVIVDKKAWDTLKKKYPLENHILKIASNEYPLFSYSEVKSHRKEIELLAALPYQGKVFPHIITVEEMQKI